MIYNGFVPIDTHQNGQWDMVGEDGFNSYPEESGDYSVPAGPGGGGSTPPTYGPFLPSGGSGGGSGSAPSGGGGDSGGGGGSWQQWVNPQTIGATVGMVGSIAGAVGAGRSPDKAKIKAVCGRKPLFNIKGKKDAYNQCVQNLMMPQPQQRFDDVPQGMSTGTKILIGSLVGLVLLAIIITIVVVMKRKNATAVTA